MRRSQPVRTIGVAWLTAGILDITSAFVIAGLKGAGSIRMLQGIASGLLGARSFEGGLVTAGLGLAIHFLIAFTAAALFYFASRKFSFLVEHAMFRDCFTESRFTLLCIGSSCRSPSRLRGIRSRET